MSYSYSSKEGNRIAIACLASDELIMCLEHKGHMKVQPTRLQMVGETFGTDIVERFIKCLEPETDHKEVLSVVSDMVRMKMDLLNKHSDSVQEAQ